MSNRERWVVYPLLFFAILLAARDDIVPPNPVRHQTLVCNQIRVETPNGIPLVSIGRSINRGIIRVHGDSEAPPLHIGHDEDLRASGLFAIGNSGEPITSPDRVHGDLPAGGYTWNTNQPDTNPADDAKSRSDTTQDTLENSEESSEESVESPSDESSGVEKQDTGAANVAPAL